MSQSGSYTRTETFTRTDARNLASRVVTDLYQMGRFYGHPSEKEIWDYMEELIVYIFGGYLDHIEYGFKRGGIWIPGAVLRYDTAAAAGFDSDDTPGGVKPNIDISGSDWYSFLTLNQNWRSLDESKRDQIKATIAIKRRSETAPGTNGLGWVQDKNYSRKGVALQRRGLG